MLSVFILLIILAELCLILTLNYSTSKELKQQFATNSVKPGAGGQSFIPTDSSFMALATKHNKRTRVTEVIEHKQQKSSPSGLN